jgi:hypothetical protein
MAGSPISWLMILKVGKEVCSKGQQAGRTPHARQRSGAFSLLNGRPKGAWTARFDELSSLIPQSGKSNRRASRGSEWWVAGLFKANRRRWVSYANQPSWKEAYHTPGLASTERAVVSLLCPSLANPKELAMRPISSFLMAKGKERRGCGLGIPLGGRLSAASFRFPMALRTNLWHTLTWR